MIKKVFTLLLTFLLLSATISCTESSGGGDDRSGDSGSSSGGSENTAELSSNCGAVVDGKTVNPVSATDGAQVTISAIPDPTVYIVELATGGSILVKLHGVKPNGLQAAALNSVQSFVGQRALFVSAGAECIATTPGGGSAQLGQLFDNSGRSLSEQLVRGGLVDVEPADACSPGSLVACYAALAESDPLTAGELDSFLWKPVSDSNGNLAIHTGPFGTSVVVNGEVGVNAGPGNGYGSLARFGRPGCSYGSPSIRVLSSEGLAYSVGGQTTFTVPNPCGRYCLIGGAIVSCSK